MIAIDFESPNYLEVVFAALFAKLKTAKFGGSIVVKSFQRAVQPPDQIDAANQPALLLIEGLLGESQEGLFGPAKWHLGAFAVVYLRADGSSASQQQVSPATQANWITWGIALALGVTYPPYQKQTLDGLVYHCWVDGQVSVEVVDQQVVVVVPISLLLGPVG